MAQLSLQRVLPTRHETTTICRAGQTCSEGLHTFAWDSGTIGGSRPAKGSCLTSLSVCRLVAQRDSVDRSSNVDSCSASVEIVAVFSPYSRQGHTDIRSGSSTQRGGGKLLLASACTSKHIERCSRFAVTRRTNRSSAMNCCSKVQERFHMTLSHVMPGG